MTPEEFKQKFKVGDVITRTDWPQRPANIITALGKEMFLSVEDDGNEDQNDMDNPWVKVEPLPKKPSEEIFKILFDPAPVHPGKQQLPISLGEQAIIKWLDENVSKWECKCSKEAKV